MRFHQHRFYDYDGKPIDLPAWTALIEGDPDGRRVALTALGAGVEVSTVWVGLDMNFTDEGPPLIYETMVFGGPLDTYQWRTPNRHAALATHDQAVAMARESIKVMGQ